MIDEEFNENQDMTVSSSYDYFVSVQINGYRRPYYFGTDDDSFEKGEKVIVDTIAGYELGEIYDEPVSTSEYKSDLPLKAVVRRATPADARNRQHFDEKVPAALEICDTEAKKLSLNMRFLTLHYSVDGAKVTVTYSAESRVDFRELLKVLAPKLNARIDLRQVPPRDRAKSIGGVGVCGLPLCCSTFINHFDGIGINKAKNQMLSLNIPKLSGSCGKLMCCLAFEDDLYTEEKQKFPQIGSTVRDGRNEYKVDSFNILSRTIRLTSALDTKTVTLDEYHDLINPNKKKAPAQNMSSYIDKKLEEEMKEREKENKAPENTYEKPQGERNNQNRHNRNRHRHQYRGKNNKGNGHQ